MVAPEKVPLLVLRSKELKGDRRTLKCRRLVPFRNPYLAGSGEVRQIGYT
jgi:hypothetical protein